MILLLEPKIPEESKKELCLRLQKQGFYTRLVEQADKIFISLDGVIMSNAQKKDISGWQYVKNIITGEYPYYIASRKFCKTDSIINIGFVDNKQVSIGGNKIVSIAGPCAIETEESAINLAKQVKKAGAEIYRAMLFKPRSSPYSFQGLGKNGISILKNIKNETGLLLLSEVREPLEIELLNDYVDMFQVGTRNMSNFQLLKYLGLSNKPVLLKRGMGASYKEFLSAAEYILVHGNPNVILCERGIRTFNTYTRFSLDIAAVPALKEISHLPIVVDPSHATGKSSLIEPMVYAAISAGADGIMVEVHANPDKAYSDGAQAITPEIFERITKKSAELAKIFGKTIKTP